MAENTQTSTAGAGGFVPSLPSPAPSTASTRSVTGLPHPRGHSLRPGSVKEDKVRHFVSARLEFITRRFVKKATESEDDDAVGYKTMGELCKDLDELINIVWLSGTPRLQIPYLMNVANEFNTWLPAFPPSPKATFGILNKLDHCFASLLAGQDVDTKEPLPGFDNGPRAGMTRTDMVRCKSIVQQTRVVVMDVMNEEPDEEDCAEADDEDDEDMSDQDGPTDWAKLESPLNDDEDRHMDMARVYEKTLVQLGETLVESGVGDIQISDD